MPTQLTIADRTLISKGSQRGMLATMHLEEVRDMLGRMAQKQDAVDYERTLNQLHVEFKDGRLQAQWLNANGLNPEVMYFSDHGANMVAAEVLPSRFFSGLKTLAGIDDQGEKLATMSWAKLSQSRKDQPVRMVRTANMRVDDSVHRVIRSCHSQGYAPYSNYEFVNDLLNNAGEYADLPVLHWKVTDGGMRLRFAGDSVDHLEIGKPMPMIEAWNSEVGLRRVGLRGGQFVLKCTNGMGHWNEKTEYGWIHRGNSDRIRNGVQNAFENLRVTASSVIDAYNEALNVQIDNAFMWMEQELEGKVTDRVLRSAQAGLADPTTTPGGLLASVIDAVTLIAQNEIDMYQQFEIEKVASSLLAKGLGIARSNDNRIRVMV